MAGLLLLALVSPALALETYTETREVVDPAGAVFSCTYNMLYDTATKKVYRTQSSVSCEPNMLGKQTEEIIVIEAIGKAVVVTYVPRVDKTGIKKTVVMDYVPGVSPTMPPTTTTTELPLSTYTETREVTDAEGTTFTCTYSLAYDPATAKVYRRRSSVACDPNTTGKETVEDIVIEDINKTATVTYVPRKDLTGIKLITLAEYVATTTSADTTTTSGDTTTTAADGTATTAADVTTTTAADDTTTTAADDTTTTAADDTTTTAADGTTTTAADDTTTTAADDTTTTAADDTTTTAADDTTTTAADGTTTTAGSCTTSEKLQQAQSLIDEATAESCASSEKLQQAKTLIDESSANCSC